MTTADFCPRRQFRVCFPGRLPSAFAGSYTGSIDAWWQCCLQAALGRKVVVVTRPLSDPTWESPSSYPASVTEERLATWPP